MIEIYPRLLNSLLRIPLVLHLFVSPLWRIGCTVCCLCATCCRCAVGSSLMTTRLLMVGLQGDKQLGAGKLRTGQLRAGLQCVGKKRVGTLPACCGRVAEVIVRWLWLADDLASCSVRVCSVRVCSVRVCSVRVCSVMMICWPLRAAVAN